MRALAPADQPGALRPVGEVDLAGQLGHPRSLARLAVLIDRRLPRRFRQGNERFADGLGERIAEREADVALAAGVGEIVAGAGGIRAREDLPVQRAPRQLLEREIQQREVILGVVRAGVPWPEDPGQHLPAAGRDQRVEPEPALVMPGRLLLLGVHIDRGRVEVEDHPLRRRARRPRPRTSRCPGRPDPCKLRLADRLHHPPRRRHRRDLAEQRLLTGQRRQIRHAPAAVREHHRQIAEHPPRLMPTLPLARARERVAQPPGQADPIRDQRQQRSSPPASTNPCRPP